MIWPCLSSEKNANKKCHARRLVRPVLSLVKKGKKEERHACRLVWPWLPMGQKKETQKMSRTPSGLPVAVISKKKGKTENVMNTIWSGLHCQWAKILRKNKKFHTCHLVWPWPSLAKTRKYKNRHACHLVWPWLPWGKKKTRNVMHAIWSGLACQRANFFEKTKAVAVIGK